MPNTASESERAKSKMPLPPQGLAEERGSASAQVAPPAFLQDLQPALLAAFKECQDLLKSRLSKPRQDLFAELTGLRLHVFWHRPLDFRKSEAPLVPGPVVPEEASAGGPPMICLACLQQCWPANTQPAPEGCRFTGPCGATCFSFTFQTDKSFPPPLTLVLHARVKDHPSAPIRETGSGLPVPTPPSAHSRLASGGRHRAVTAAAFDRAVALLWIYVRDLETAVQAWSAGRELEHLQRRLRRLEAENTQPHPALPRGLPEKPKASKPPPPNSRCQGNQIVQEMTAYLHQHYHRPISLNEVAAHLRMNASYLSSLFSQTLGITYHRYLEEIRLARAKELLREPRRRIREVARAVGYASPDQFRHTFKLRVGVSPSDWR